MPEKKGRKRHQRARRHDAGRTAARVASPQASKQPLQPTTYDRQPSAVPPLRIRYAGFVLALLTMFIGIVTAADAFTAGRGGVNFIFRIVAGVALIVLALVIAALAVIPDRVGAFLRRS